MGRNPGWRDFGANFINGHENSSSPLNPTLFKRPLDRKTLGYATLKQILNSINKPNSCVRIHIFHQIRSTQPTKTERCYTISLKLKRIDCIVQAKKLVWIGVR